MAKSATPQQRLMIYEAEKIFDAIEGLDDFGKFFLFERLKDIYSLKLEVERERRSFSRPWHDPRYGFGEMQARLLDWLDARDGPVQNRETIRVIWDDEWPPEQELKTWPEGGFEEFEARLQVRLRDLKRSTNERLYETKCRFKITRPRNGEQELSYW
jgi:hypothetical protein